jgi:hypothetical protein
MFLFDPSRGRGRRARARDKLIRIGHKAADGVDAAGRDLANRGQGLASEVKAHVMGDSVPDEVLTERVRARLGRVVSHPHAIEVAVEDGRVRLSGPILAEEVSDLLRSTRAVRGVRAVDSALDVHEHPDKVPALQASRTPPRSRRRWENPLSMIATAVGFVAAGFIARRIFRSSDPRRSASNAKPTGAPPSSTGTNPPST